MRSLEYSTPREDSPQQAKEEELQAKLDEADRAAKENPKRLSHSEVFATARNAVRS